MRIGIIDRDRCQPKKCTIECMRFCPRVRSGDETVVIAEDGKPVISEELCVGCGICVKKCPFASIAIIELPEELKEIETHRYGRNGFALYGLAIPQAGRVTGILGPNGIGKTTVVRILSGAMKPNLGRSSTTWSEVFEHYSGSELQEYFKKLRRKASKTSLKPQYIEQIPKHFTGSVKELLSKLDERKKLEEIAEQLDLKPIFDRKVEGLSGGELQRLAIAACALRKADFYFFDEITPYLDIFQRIKVAKLMREVAKEGNVMIVEHDLAILDLLADAVHIAYGEAGCYGVITHPKGVRVGINEYLKGFLREENIRIRPAPIKFEVIAPRKTKEAKVLVEFGSFTKQYEKFKLEADKGELRKGEVIGIVGPNGIGKSTFIKILAGVESPTAGELDLKLRVSYKPQYAKAEQEISVQAFLRQITDQFGSSYYKAEISKPLQLERLLDIELADLSGGELQRVAIAACLSKKADLYLLDEPSAHLDVEQRVLAAKVIRRFAEHNEVTALVVDHDIYSIDMISDRLLVFEGKPTIHGKVLGPFDMREGMNRFLRGLDLTFRRDEDTKRPRVNKPDSKLDREQKAKGEYYYYD